MDEGAPAPAQIERGAEANEAAEQAANAKRSETPDNETRDRRSQSGTGEDRTETSAKPGKRKVLRRTSVKIALAAVIGAVLASGLMWWLNARQFQSTNDAYIAAHMVHLAAQTSGQVTAVEVTDNATVAPHQMLVQIQPKLAQNQLDQARAARDQAQAELDQALAALGVDSAQQEKAQSQVSAAQATATNAEREFGRVHALHQVSRSTVSQTELDNAQTQAKTAGANLKAASRQAKAASAQVVVATSQATAAAAQLRAAQAKIAAAKINLGYVHIAAPIGGTVANLSVAAGDYVQPGQDLMAIVPQNVWVKANFKETQIAKMHSGEKGTVKIDACDAGPLPAHVVSIQHGAGQAFTLLPPQNASGNFVKVVQRVPVKIALDEMPKGCTIGPGMSVEARVKVR